MFDRYRFLQSRVAKLTEDKNAMQAYKDEIKVIQGRNGLEMLKNCKGYPNP